MKTPKEVFASHLLATAKQKPGPKFRQARRKAQKTQQGLQLSSPYQGTTSQ